MTISRRAEPLAPAARRRSIIDAVLPLLIERGAHVTTRELADAAGVAEGTLFSVFDGKRALILAAIEHRLDPEPLLEDLATLDATAPLERRLEHAARTITDRSEGTGALMSLLRTLARDEAATGPSAGPPAFVTAWSEAVVRGVEALLEPHRARLRVAPEQAATTLIALLFANRHPIFSPRERPTPAAIVDVLLHGVAATSDGSAADASAGDVPASEVPASDDPAGEASTAEAHTAEAATAQARR